MTWEARGLPTFCTPLPAAAGAAVGRSEDIGRAGSFEGTRCGGSLTLGWFPDITASRNLTILSSSWTSTTSSRVSAIASATAPWAMLSRCSAMLSFSSRNRISSRNRKNSVPRCTDQPRQINTKPLRHGGVQVRGWRRMQSTKIEEGRASVELQHR